MTLVHLIFFIILVCLVYSGIVNSLLVVPVILGGQPKQDIDKTYPPIVLDDSSLPYENILVVDVANMFTGWYMEKYCIGSSKKRMPYMKQPELLRRYLECASDHYKHFIKHNNEKKDAVNYVIKNFRHTHAVGKNEYDNYMPELTSDDWDLCHEFVRKYKNAMISMAIDYRIIPLHKWKDKHMHYLRGRDDYLCFKLAQAYKKKYINAVIMSDDKYRDFDQFGFVPDFRAYYIRNIKNKAVQNGEIIRPEPNRLGQIKDYKLVKITTEFNFNDPKFIKTSDYKISTPGHVWK